MAEQEPNSGAQFPTVARDDEADRSGPGAYGAKVGGSGTISNVGVALQDPGQNLETGYAAAQSAPRLPWWVHQWMHFLVIYLRLIVGLALCVLPWAGELWDSNPLLSEYPGLLEVMKLGAVRGMVSGLGLLNLWIALRDAMQGARGAGQR